MVLVFVLTWLKDIDMYLDSVFISDKGCFLFARKYFTNRLAQRQLLILLSNIFYNDVTSCKVTTNCVTLIVINLFYCCIGSSSVGRPTLHKYRE